MRTESRQEEGEGEEGISGNRKGEREGGDSEDKRMQRKGYDRHGRERPGERIMFTCRHSLLPLDQEDGCRESIRHCLQGSRIRGTRGEEEETDQEGDGKES